MVDMDENVVGFLLGCFMAVLGFAAILASVGLAYSTIRKMQKRDSGIKIILYAIETITPLSIVIAIAWSVSDSSYNPTALWIGICLAGVMNMFLLFHKTPYGSPFMRIWNSVKAELANGKEVDGQR
jgi:hypothetical protein